MAVRPRAPGRPASYVACVALAISACAALATYARVIPGGHWQGDEFGMLHAIQRVGIRYPFDRMIGAETTGLSPRPLSELLDWAYMRTVMAVQRPLIPEILGLLWMGAIALSTVIPSGWRDGRGMATGLALLALAIMLRASGEAFYWPIGACAYVLMIGALIGVTVLLRRPLCDLHDRWRLMALLLVAACSNEIGATVVLIWSGLAGVVIRGRRSWRVPVLVPGVVAAVVCGLTWFGRMQDASEVWDHTTPFAHATGASLLGALPILGQIVLNGPVLGDGIAPGASTGCAIVMAALVLFARSVDAPAPDRRLALAWAVAAIVGAWLSIAAALRAFGTYCCQRHTSVQETLVLVAVATAAGLVPLVLGRTRTLLLAAGIAALLDFRMDALRQTVKILPSAAHARTENWIALRGPNPAIRFVTAPATAIVNGNDFAVGTFRRTDPSTPWYARAILDGFDKETLTVVPP